VPGVRPNDAPVLVGQSAAMDAVRVAMQMAARTDATVLIEGETGVGKELVARGIHAQSMRATRPFIAVNAGGIPDTLLESELFGHTRGSFTGAFRDKLGLLSQADGGTLFLDEVGEMSPRMQAVLLRAVETGEIQRVGANRQEKRVDVRLITATHRDLRALIESGGFRADLYYRLNVLQIHVPPLRDREEDILLLLSHYLQRAAQHDGRPVPTWTPETASCVLGYRWPGNIRELRNLAERLVAHDRPHPLTPAELPPEIRLASPFDVSTTDMPPAGTPGIATADRVQRLWEHIRSGGDFWTVVHQPYKRRELTRVELAALIDRGLRETRGNYRSLLRVFHLRPTEYKRFHAFLYQQQCNLPVGPYRKRSPRSSPDECAATPYDNKFDQKP
jgi:DNA-binding NtrC family response regulator